MVGVFRVFIFSTLPCLKTVFFLDQFKKMFGSSKPFEINIYALSVLYEQGTKLESCLRVYQNFYAQLTLFTSKIASQDFTLNMIIAHLCRGRILFRYCFVSRILLNFPSQQSSQQQVAKVPVTNSGWWPWSKANQVTVEVQTPPKNLPENLPR